MAIKVALLGVGRMGKAVARLISEAEGMEVVAAFDVSSVGGEISGVEITDVSDLQETLEKVKPDVVVDFTSAGACMENVKVVAAAGVNTVIGTTGFTEKQLKELKETLKDVGAVISPNMSVGVNVFWQIIGEVAKKLKDYDIEVVEAHHKFKKDAPSGTALKAVEILADAVGANVKEDIVYGRKRMSPRRKGEIGVHSIRAGDIVGEHTVVFGTIGEHLEIKHAAHSRDAFASGVIEAIKFIRKKKGIYDMGDVLGLK
jgi:4-hydroxy-tetrahydrodipicolinate reductase